MSRITSILAPLKQRSLKLREGHQVPGRETGVTLKSAKFAYRNFFVPGEREADRLVCVQAAACWAPAGGTADHAREGQTWPLPQHFKDI
jgi:hypothetical protein